METLVEAITEFGAHLKCPIWCVEGFPALAAPTARGPACSSSRCLPRLFAVYR